MKARLRRVRVRVLYNRVRLPFTADDVGERPPRHIGCVEAKRVAGPMRDDAVPMNQIDNAPHLGEERRVPCWIIVALLLPSRRELCPDALNQPEWVIAVRGVPAREGPIEMRWMDRVDAKGIGVHPG